MNNIEERWGVNKERSIYSNSIRKIKNLMNSKKDLEAEITKLENRNRELEVDLTVKERMRLEKGEEIKIISGKLTELEQKKDTDWHEFIEQKRER